MGLHIVIDGYNLIRQSPALSAAEDISTEQGRNALLALLVQYHKLKRHKITVVFDAAYADSLGENKIRQGGITVIYSRRGELADDVIKRMVARERERVLTVTSDRDIVDFAVHNGAATIDSSEFEMRMNMASYETAKGIDEDYEEEKGWSMTTRKKGPARRLPRHKRRSRLKINKL